jgi:ribosomal protein S18 acetylase RimI-like enzyme
MPDDITIRDLQPADADAVVAIAVAAWTPIFACYRDLLGDDVYHAICPDWLAYKAQRVRAACEGQLNATVCVAERAGRIVGFVSFMADEATLMGEIGNNAVHPDYQGQGIGPRMYAHALARLRALGMRGVKVSTGADEAHARARRAYEKMGFDRQLGRVDYYRML